MLYDEQRLKEMMEGQKLDALVCISPENVRYLSGFWALEPHNAFVAVIITKDSGSVLLTPIPEMGGILSTECWVKDRRYYGRYYIEGADYEVQDEDPIKAIRSILRELRVSRGRIGIEESFFPYKTYLKILGVISEVKFVDVGGALSKLRMIKTEEEVRRIRDIVKISEGAYLKALATGGEGVSELEVAKALKASLVEQEAAWTFIEMGAGKRGGLVNAKPTDYRMKKGDVLRLDLGTISKGYCSDLSRDAVIGPITEKQEKIHNALMEGHQRMMEEIRAGVELSELFKTGMDTVRKTFPNYWRLNLGHGIGLGTHEPPHIKLDEEGCLKSGMVLTIELPYYLAEDGGYNIEDVLIITDDGSESISTMDRSIYIL